MSKIFSINEVAVLNESSIQSTDSFDFISYLDTSSLTKNRIDDYQLLNDNFPSRAKRKVKKNTILYSTVRPNQEHYGIFETINVDKNIIVSTGFTTIDVFHKEVNPKYLFYKLTQKEITNYLQTIAENSVSAYPSIKPSDIGELNFKFPDTSIQQHIASVLSSLDDKIELNNRINAELEAMAKTLYDYWFVQFDFPDANGKPYKSSGGKMVYNEEIKREIPEEWEVDSVEFIGIIIGGSTPSTKNPENFTTDGIGWITPKDLSLNKSNKFISKGEIDVTPKGIKDASLNLMPRGTILMSSRAPVGYLAIAHNEVTTNQGFKSFVPQNYFSTEYIYYTIKNLIPVIERNSSGSTFKEISASTLKTIKIPIAAKTLIEIYTNKITSIFNRQEYLENENQRLASLRDWLLPMLMNGQVGFKDTYQAPKASLSAVAEPEVVYKKSNTQAENYHKIQSTYTIIWANNLVGVQQGEMALAKDLYLVDRIFGVNTGYSYAQHNWGSFDPTFKQTINNKQYFEKKNFDKSRACYWDLNDNGKLLDKISVEMKGQIKSGIELLHNKVFHQYTYGKKPEMKELFATVLKCIEDTQSTELSVIRKEMKCWKTPKQKFADKAAKFAEQQTKEALDVILREGWHINVMK